MVCPSVQCSSTFVSSISSTIWHLHASWRETTFCLLVRTKMIKHQSAASVPGENGTDMLHLLIEFVCIFIYCSIPDWLTSVYKSQWFAMLRTEFDNDNG